LSILAVIPCLNEAAHLPELLDQMLADETIEMLVVADGGSTDGSREIVKQRMATTSRLQLLDNPARIQSAGVNRAVAEFGGDKRWLLRIDAHCSYPDGYCATLLKAAVKNNAHAVVVPMLSCAGGGFQQAVAAAQNSALGNGASPHRHIKVGGWVDHGHHALMDLGFFRRAGGYCESMPCNEDAEYDHRQRQLGARTWLEPNAAITYYPRKSIFSLWRQYFRYGAGRARNVKRHGQWLKIRQALPLAVPPAVVTMPLAAMHWVFALPAMIWLSGCLVVGTAVGARSGGGWALLGGIAAATMHLAWGLGFLREYSRPRHYVSPKLAFDQS
jgi:succinoglycan biosynthesis protein ExoA